MSPSFLLDEVHLWHVNADATSLPASTLPWFQDVGWFNNFFQPFIDDIVQQLIHAFWQDYWSLVRRFIRVSTFMKLRHGAVHRCSLSTCVFCQNVIHPHFHNLEFLVRHRFCEIMRASIWTCALTWFQTDCKLFLNLLAGEFSSQTAWLMDSAVLSVSISNLTIKSISPLLCLKIVNCQSC